MPTAKKLINAPSAKILQNEASLLLPHYFLMCPGRVKAGLTIYVNQESRAELSVVREKRKTNLLN